MVVKICRILLYLTGVLLTSILLYFMGLIGALAFVFGNYKLAIISFGLIFLVVISFVLYIIEVIKDMRGR